VILDPTWAAPINTALTIVLAVVYSRLRRDHSRTKREFMRDVHDVKKKVGADRRTYDEAQDQLVRDEIQRHGPIPFRDEPNPPLADDP
jgi:hypothetical protein